MMVINEKDIIRNESFIKIVKYKASLFHIEWRFNLIIYVALRWIEGFLSFCLILVLV